MISKDFQGFPMISKDFQRFPRISKDSKDFQFSGRDSDQNSGRNFVQILAKILARILAKLSTKNVPPPNTGRQHETANQHEKCAGKRGFRRRPGSRGVRVARGAIARGNGGVPDPGRRRRTPARRPKITDFCFKIDDF